MRIAVTAGGTGGHVLPAMAVVEALRVRTTGPVDVRFFGPDDRGERRLVAAHDLPFEVTPSAPVRGKSPLQLARAVVRLAWGTLVALRKLRAFRPDAVFSTGGYASFPACVAARLLRRPLVVFLPDVAPGWAVRAELRLATRLATTTEAALDHLPRSKTVVTGYPVRPGFFGTSFADARVRLDIEPSDHVILVTGASQGAHAINRAVFDQIAVLTTLARVHHITGDDDLATAQAAWQRLPAPLQDRYHPAPFRADLPDLMVAADLGILRAGASSLGEIPAAGLPALLVPGTFAGGHQYDNARWLEQAGAVEIIDETELYALAERASALLGDPARLSSMAASARTLARPGAAEAIADLLIQAAQP